MSGALCFPKIKFKSQSLVFADTYNRRTVRRGPMPSFIHGFECKKIVQANRANSSCFEPAAKGRAGRPLKIIQLSSGSPAYFEKIVRTYSIPIGVNLGTKAKDPARKGACKLGSKYILLALDAIEFGQSELSLSPGPRGFGPKVILFNLHQRRSVRGTICTGLPQSPVILQRRSSLKAGS